MESKGRCKLMLYCDGTHLISNESIPELHSFARCMGIPREQFIRKRLPRYTVTKEQSQKCFIMGALYVTRKQLIWLLRKFKNKDLDQNGVRVYQGGLNNENK